MTSKPILCLDFDGVLHSFTSGWVEADFIPDPPVPGAMQFLADAVDVFDVRIFSSRSRCPEGIRAMRIWVYYWARRELPQELAAKVEMNLSDRAWPTEKPPAFVSLDDRALTFTGTWPALEDLRAFQPWNKRS